MFLNLSKKLKTFVVRIEVSWFRHFLQMMTAYRGHHNILLCFIYFSHVVTNCEQDQLLGIPLTQIRQRLFDQASQCIITSVNDSHKLTLYRRYKKDIKSEHYLSSIRDAKYKIALSKFRLSSHSLLIETGRYTGIPTEERLCNFCNMRKIEDEFHFLLVCPHYIELRRKYLKRYFCTWPTLNKFDQLLSTSSKKTLTNLSKYIYYAFKKRNTA